MMKTFRNVLRSEWLKLRKSSIWLLIFVSPLTATLIGMAEDVPADPEMGWIVLMSTMAMLHALLFMPLLAGIFSAFVCRYEHQGGGWKQVLALPVPRHYLYLAKFLLVILLLAGTQLVYLGGLLSAAYAKGLLVDIPWSLILKSVLGGWVAVLPLAALQLGVSVAWVSFAAPLAVNVILTLPNMLIVNSADYGPYYPWAQPLLAMIPTSENNFGAMNVPFNTLLYVIFGSFIVFLSLGLRYFTRKEV